MNLDVYATVGHAFPQVPAVVACLLSGVDGAALQTAAKPGVSAVVLPYSHPCALCLDAKVLGHYTQLYLDSTAH